MDMLELDGAHGGGQLLRTALSLSLCTGIGFTLQRIRAQRSKPGLMRQHLTAVNAATQIGSARVHGADLGSTTLRFEPGDVRAGDYAFATGSAGSTTLVLQTVIPALWRCDAESSLRIEGGTHNPLAPSADFIVTSWVPRLREIGIDIEVELLRHGFAPAGGGVLQARVGPSPSLRQASWCERGADLGMQATALLSGLSSDIGRRELAALRANLGILDEALHLRSVRNALGPGNALQVEARFGDHTSTFTGHGARGVTAEVVAGRLSGNVQRFVASDAVIEEHLSDQLLLPLALAGGGAFTTTAPSEHLRSNAALIEKFLEVDIRWEEQTRDCWRVTISS